MNIYKKYINSQKLIIFFNGFSLDEYPYNLLDNDEYDLLIISDFRNCSYKNIVDICENYKIINVVSYSLGVYICVDFLLKTKTQFSNLIAINGTLQPISKEFGINPAMFDLTIRNFDANGRTAFYKNLFSSSEHLESFLLNQPQRQITEQKEELINLKEYVSHNDFSTYSNFFNKIIVSEKDRIIPTQNQLNFWNGKNIVTINAGHFPFYNFKSWKEIIER